MPPPTTLLLVLLLALGRGTAGQTARFRNPRTAQQIVELFNLGWTRGSPWYSLLLGAPRFAADQVGQATLILQFAHQASGGPRTDLCVAYANAMRDAISQLALTPDPDDYSKALGQCQGAFAPNNHPVPSLTRVEQDLLVSARRIATLAGVATPNGR